MTKGMVDDLGNTEYNRKCRERIPMFVAVSRVVVSFGIIGL